MKKTFFILATLVLLLAFMLPGTAWASGDFAEGDGSEETPYLIENWHHLNNVRNYSVVDAVYYQPDTHFRLNANLDATTPGYNDHASDSANDGQGWEPIGAWDELFTGIFKGGGHTITGLFINRPNSWEVGLFGYADSGAQIQNVGLIDVNIMGEGSVGGLVGYNEGGTITGSYVTGSVTGSDLEVGGLVGYNDGGSITDSYATGDVEGTVFVGGLVGYNLEGTITNSYVTGVVTGDEQVGGLVGYNDGGSITGSYFVGTVTGNNYVGGLVGENDRFIDGGSITSSYAMGDVDGDSDVGGLIGVNFMGNIANTYFVGTVTGLYKVGGLVGNNGGTITNSFYNTDTAGSGVVDGVGIGNSTGVTGLTTAEMKTYATFFEAGWDFIAETTNGTDNTWGIDESGVANNGYPFLAWQGFDHQLLPEVITDEVTAITATTATVRGDITNLGYPNPTQHGVVWSTSENPTIADNKTEDGGATITGAFTSGITGLHPNTTYFVRAYATNSTGTVYGEQVEFTTEKMALTITADAKSKIYGEVDPALTYQITAGTLVGSDAITGALTREAGENAGSYSIEQGTLTAGDNYIITYEGANLTITPKVLTVTAENKSKAYGADDPEFTVSYDGFIAGENETDLSGTLAFTREPGEDVGTYIITPSGLTSVNYEITFVTGTLTILNSNNADLSSLTLSSGTLSPAFDSETTGYTVNVTNSVSSTTVTPTGSHPGATITVNGTPVTSGQASGAISLSVGANTINVVVMAEDGVTVKTYAITVTRASASTGGGGGGSTPPAEEAEFQSGPTEAESNTSVISGDSVEKETTTTEDGKTIETFTVKSEVQEQIARAKEEGKTTVEINVASNQEATTVVNVPAEVLQSSTGMNIAVTTPNATLELPAALVEALAAAGQDLSITVERGDAETVSAQISDVTGTEGAQVLGTPTAINTAVTGNTNVTIPLAGITFPDDPGERENFLASLAVFAIHSDGEKTVRTGEIIYDANDNPVGIKFTVDKFSTFAVIKLADKQDFQLEKPQVKLTDINGHWAEVNIMELVATGAITGYPDGTFKPNNNIARGEFVAILVKAFNLEGSTGKVFADTTEHWAKEFISTAASNGVVTGYDETTFGPNDLITREQMAVMVTRAANLSLQAGEMNFLDGIEISQWAAAAVFTASQQGIITGYPDNTFKPKGNATRAEATTLILKAIK